MLADPQAAPRLQRQLAVGAWLHEQPVGLAWLSAPLGADDAAGAAPRELLSVMVAPLLRRMGIARRLLERAQELAATQGCPSLQAFHSSRLPARAGYEALLRACGWSAPVPCESRLAGKAGWALAARDDWAPLLARWRAAGFSACDWGAVDAAARADIARVVATELPAADRLYDPLRPDLQATAIPALSLLLRRHGRPVGWLLGSPGLLPATVYYAQGYVLPALQRQGWLLAGMREVCERQAALLGPDSLATFVTAQANANMQRVMQRQLGRYAQWMDERYLSLKPLAAPAAGKRLLQ
ncbi:MAG: GNAT family N-acetyltransferase [Ramlibacter sp.]